MKYLTSTLKLSLISFIILNFLFNLIKKEIIVFFNTYDLVLSILLFSLIYFVAVEIRIALDLQNTSLAIVLFIMSFFIFENIFQLFFSNYTFNINFLVTNIFWIFFLIYKNLRFYKIFRFVGIFLILRIFRKYFFIDLTININLRGDVKEYFFLHAKNIFENSYSYSIKNPIIEGYPQFSSYLQDVITQFLLPAGEYVYLISSTLVLLLISVFVIYEIIDIPELRILIITLYTSLILNSDYLQFLFVSSLMSEGIITLVTVIIFYNLSKFYENNNVTNVVVFFLAGNLYFAKQFTSFIIVLLCLYFLYKKYYKFSLLIGSGILLKELSFLLIFKNITKSHHLSQIDIQDTIFDLILFRDLNLLNIFEILNNLFKDIPMTIITITFLVSVVSLIIQRKLDYSTVFLISIFTLNVIFVFILYISAWRGMELDSPIRFIYTYLLIQLIVIGKSFELEKKF